MQISNISWTLLVLDSSKALFYDQLNTPGNTAEMPQSVAIQERLKRFEENNQANATGKQQQQHTSTTNAHQMSKHPTYFSNQQAGEQQQYSHETSQPSIGDDASKQVKGLAQENRVCKHISLFLLLLLLLLYFF